ncbi:hypothetical protein ACFL4T_03480 [candidate division KSB1 bacterium]
MLKRSVIFIVIVLVLISFSRLTEGQDKNISQSIDPAHFYINKIIYYCGLLHLNHHQMNDGQYSSLITKLDNAYSSVNKIKYKAALGQLTGFRHQFEAFCKSGKIDTDHPVIKRIVESIFRNVNWAIEYLSTA